MPRRRSLIIQRGDSGNYRCNFTVDGRRFRDGLGNDREIAEDRAREIYRAALGAKTGKRQELTLTRALARYWLEHAQHLASANDIKRMGLTLERELGKDLRLSAITPNLLAGYVARRRAGLSNRSVNIEVEHLRAVMRRADILWGAAVPDPPLQWKTLLLDEPAEAERILSAEQQQRLFLVLRPDYHAMMRFALLSGARRGNVVGLRWDQVDWEARTITWRVKSRKPGGKLHVIALTPSIAAILQGERGRHPEFVFTYECRRSRFDPRSHEQQRKGRRYPFTLNGWRKEWYRAVAAAKIAGFRFHDFRHTALTRTLRATGNLELVRRQGGHQDIKTTQRYAKHTIDDLRTGMMASEELIGPIPAQGISPAAQKRRQRK